MWNEAFIQHDMGLFYLQIINLKIKTGLGLGWYSELIDMTTWLLN